MKCLLTLILSTLALANAVEKSYLRTGGERNLQVAAVPATIEASWDLYVDMPDYDHIFGGEDFVVGVGRKLEKKVTADASIFPAAFEITAKVEEQVEVTASQRRELQQRDLVSYVWVPNKKISLKITGRCGTGCTADNGDRRKLMTEQELEAAGTKFLKQFYNALGRSIDMVNDIRAMRLVANVPEYGIHVDVFYAPVSV